MEYLRWILLVAGCFFVLVIYLVGRSRRRQDSYSDYDLDEEAPEFSARNWDEAEEGVGEMRIVARENSDAEHREFSDDQSTDGVSLDEQPDDQPEAASEDPIEHQSEQQDNNTGIIVLYILARPPGQLAGDKINSVAQANGLVFGEMNIFHRFDKNKQSIFSLANMVEPGNFDPDVMHEMQTSGITLFMQVSTVADPDSAFDEMLQCAYRMSEMLEAQLCNRNRLPLTQSDAEQYRELVGTFHASS